MGKSKGSIESLMADGRATIWHRIKKTYYDKSFTYLCSPCKGAASATCLLNYFILAPFAGVQSIGAQSKHIRWQFY